MHLDIFNFWNSNKLREFQRWVIEYWDLVGLVIISNLSHAFYWINIQIGGNWFTDSPHHLNFNFIFGRKHLSKTSCDIMRYSIMIFSEVFTIKRTEELLLSEMTQLVIYIISFLMLSPKLKFRYCCFHAIESMVTTTQMSGLSLLSKNKNKKR